MKSAKHVYIWCMGYCKQSIHPSERWRARLAPSLATEKCPQQCGQKSHLRLVRFQQAGSVCQHPGQTVPRFEGSPQEKSSPFQWPSTLRFGKPCGILGGKQRTLHTPICMSATLSEESVGAALREPTTSRPTRSRQHTPRGRRSILSFA